MIIAKYLPVDEKSPEFIFDPSNVEKGDLLRSEDGAMFLVGRRKEIHLAKLFAVTRDIKEGDEVWDYFKGVKHGIADKVHEVFIELKDVTYDIDRSNGGAVKILGELSPNATWVKDGDEVELKTDLGFPVIYGASKHPNGYCGSEAKPKGGEYFKVKCPTCNTYH